MSCSNKSFRSLAPSHNADARAESCISIGLRSPTALPDSKSCPSDRRYDTSQRTPNRSTQPQGIPDLCKHPYPPRAPRGHNSAADCMDKLISNKHLYVGNKSPQLSAHDPQPTAHGPQTRKLADTLIMQLLLRL